MADILQTLLQPLAEIAGLGDAGQATDQAALAVALTFLAAFVGLAVFVVPALVRLQGSSAPKLAAPWRAWLGGFLPRPAAQDAAIARTRVPGVGEVFVVNTAQGEAGAQWALENPAASLVNGYQTEDQAWNGAFLQHKAIHTTLGNASALAWTKKALQSVGRQGMAGERLATTLQHTLTRVLDSWGARGSLEHALTSMTRIVAELSVAAFVVPSLEASAEGSVAQTAALVDALVDAVNPDRLGASLREPTPAFTAAAEALKPASTCSWLGELARTETTPFAATLFAILVTATHNTALTLTSCLFLVASNPEISRSVTALVDSTPVPTGASLAHIGAQYPLIDACLRETLRLTDHSIAVRRTTERVRLGKFTVPPNSLLALDHRPLMLNAELFAAPRVFKPNRFEKDAPAAKAVPADAADDERPLQLTPPSVQRVQQAASLTTGAGEHPCPGASLSFDIIKLVVATVLSRFRVDFSLPVVSPLTGKRVSLPPNGLQRTPLSPLSAPAAPLELCYAPRAARV